MQTIYFKNLYLIEAGDLDRLDKQEEKYFIFQGRKNWDLYFNKPLSIGSEKLNNVKLFAFDEENSFEKYLPENEIIDYSIEHITEKGVEKYFVLRCDR